MKTFTLKIMTCEEIHLNTMECEDIVSFIFAFSSLLSHRNHRTVKQGPSEQSHKTDVMLNPNPMSSSEDNESKSYLELAESALLVAQAKLPRVFEIKPLDMCRFLTDTVSALWERGSPDLLACGPWRGSTSGPVRPVSVNQHSRPSRGAKPREANDTRPPQKQPHQGGSRGGGEIKARGTS